MEQREERRFRFLDFVFLIVLVPLVIYSLYSFFNADRPIVNKYYINGQDNLTVVAENSLPGTVVVLVSDDGFDSYGLGSGFMVYEGGYIATNYHVIEWVIDNSNREICISHHGQDLYEYHEAEIVWYNANLDVAILWCECEGKDDLGNEYRVLPMNDRTVFTTEENRLRPLESVITIGSPTSMLYRDTVTAGEVSGFDRVSASSTNIYEHLIQITAPINHGNSGGPLIDRSGNVIGLNTLGLLEDEYGNPVSSMFFAVPIVPIQLVIERVAAKWEANGGFLRIPVMGITAYDMYTGSNFYQEGVFVAGVSESGASHEKLDVNDIITGVKVKGITYPIKLMNDLTYALLRCNPGDTIEIFCEGKLFSKTITLR